MVLTSIKIWHSSGVDNAFLNLSCHKQRLSCKFTENFGSFIITKKGRKGVLQENTSSLNHFCCTYIRYSVCVVIPRYLKGIAIGIINRTSLRLYETRNRAFRNDHYNAIKQFTNW